MNSNNKSKGIPGESPARADRRYERYALSYAGDTPAHVEITVQGKVVQIVNFSMGGIYILSPVPFSPGTDVVCSAKFGNQREMDFTGTVIRVTKEKEGDLWGIAIDLSKNYNPATLHKL